MCNDDGLIYKVKKQNRLKGCVNINRTRQIVCPVYKRSIQVNKLQRTT